MRFKTMVFGIYPPSLEQIPIGCWAEKSGNSGIWWITSTLSKRECEEDDLILSMIIDPAKLYGRDLTA